MSNENQTSECNFEELYAQLEEIVTENKLDISASGLHGRLCGLMLVHGRFDDASWINLALSQHDLAATLSEDQQQALGDMAILQGLMQERGVWGFIPWTPDTEASRAEPSATDKHSGLWCQITALQDWNQHFFKALQQFSKLEKVPLGQDTKRGLKSMKRFANAELNWQDFAKSEANGEANDDSFTEMFCLTRDTFWLFHDDLKAKSTALVKASKKGRKF
jgi:uncharacterized protein YgfB (UPF0149 family)